MSSLVINPYSCHPILTPVVVDYVMYAVSGFYMEMLQLVTMDILEAIIFHIIPYY